MTWAVPPRAMASLKSLLGLDDTPFMSRLPSNMDTTGKAADYYALMTGACWKPTMTLTQLEWSIALAVRNLEEAIQAFQKASRKSAKQRYSTSICQRKLQREILLAQLQLLRAKELSRTCQLKRRVERRVSRAVHKAVSVLNKVCHGLIKAGAGPAKICQNFLTRYLLPLPRNDKIYA